MRTERTNRANYTYHISWSAADDEYVGTCTEFGPMLSWLAPSPQEALSGIVRAVADAVEDMAKTGETPP